MINQNKCEKRHNYTSRKYEGTWFPHIEQPQMAKTETINMSTITGPTLSQCKITEKYPKIFKNTEHKSENRQFPYSAHDNRETIRDSVEAFDTGLGCKKFYRDGRTNYSRFFLWSPGKSDGGLGLSSSYRTDYLSTQEVSPIDTCNHRRFPRNHLEKNSAALTYSKVDGNFPLGRN
ncbi:hypothetical protein DPEC_G00031690 [Dallia pectoralis]|uniref:Uncharacterized protein n=1 Tax=Dallia pectoralis TaxID=75939 RepID=A0ACC2HD04_DALPE|nr:hypothetical protein DPEC_G00031690 [Dallia pectoralis]